MKDTALIKLLSNFNPNEITDFGKFLLSPLFSQKRDVKPMFYLIRPYYPKFDSSDFTKEFIFRKLFPGKDINDPKSYAIFRIIMSELYRQCKEFLVYVDFKKDTFRRKYYLLNQLRLKKAYNEFDKEYKDITEMDEKSETDFVELMMNKYFLTSAFKNYSLEKDRFKDAFEATLKTREYSVLTALVNSFMHEDEKTLAFGYNVKIRKNAVDALLENTDMEKLLVELGSTGEKLYPFVNTFYLVYKMNKNNSNENYFGLKSYVNKHLKIFSRNDKYTLLSILSTYCSARTTGTERDLFRRELFEIHKLMIDTGIYKRTDKQTFHIVLFRNIIFNASRINEAGWLRPFIEKYTGELNTDHRQSMFNYAMAHLCFIENKFEEALEFILKIKFDLFLYKIDLKYLLMQIYYELNYFEQAYSLLDSNLHYIKNTKELHERTKLSATKFHKYVNELVKMKERKNFDRIKIDYLRKKLSEEKFVGCYEWLSAKVEEMRG